MESRGLLIEELLAYKEFYRAELIAYSWECKRTYGDGYFADSLLEQVKDERYVWIDDLRFFVELDRLTKRNAKNILITCNDKARAERGWVFVPDVDLEASECELDDLSVNFYDAALDNSGSFEDSRTQLFNKVSLWYPKSIAI